jgi:hypothetical protein
VLQIPTQFRLPSKTQSLKLDNLPPDHDKFLTAGCEQIFLQ